MLMSNNPDLARCDAALLPNQGAGRHAAGLQFLAKPVAALIHSNSSERYGASPQGANVDGHVARTAWETLRLGVAIHQDNGNRNFRRNSCGLAAKEFVQQKVTEHTDRLAAEFANDLRQRILNWFHKSWHRRPERFLIPGRASEPSVPNESISLTAVQFWRRLTQRKRYSTLNEGTRRFVIL